MFAHFKAAFIFEVNIDIRHFNALRRQKTLEQQAILKRIEVGNFKCIRHNSASSRTTTRPNANALTACPLNVLLHNQKIRRKALMRNDAHFIGSTFSHVRRHRQAVAFLQAALDALAKPLNFRVAFRPLKARQNNVALKLNVALLGNFHRVVARFRHIGKSSAHLGFRFQIKLLMRKLFALIIVHFCAVAYAQQQIVSFSIFAGHVIGIVRCNKRHIKLGSKLFQRGVQAHLVTFQKA